MRQLLTKSEAFVVLNCMILIAFYLTGGLQWTKDSIFPAAIVLIVVNGAAAVSANHFKDWKK